MNLKKINIGKWLVVLTIIIVASIIFYNGKFSGLSNRFGLSVGGGILIACWVFGVASFFSAVVNFFKIIINADDGGRSVGVLFSDLYLNEKGRLARKYFLQSMFLLLNCWLIFIFVGFVIYYCFYRQI